MLFIFTVFPEKQTDIRTLKPIIKCGSYLNTFFIVIKNEIERRNPSFWGTNNPFPSFKVRLG